MSQRLIRRNIPLVLTFLVGMIVLSDWFIKWDPLQNFTGGIMNFQIIMTAFMMGFAAVNLFVTHSRKIRRNMNQENYFEVLVSGLLLGTMIIWAFVGTVFGDQSSTYQWMYDTFNVPLGATAYAATLFYLSSAAYRVLRVRSIETGILLAVGVFTLFANMPMFVNFWYGFQIGKGWISDVLVKGSYRAIAIGVGIGGIMMGVRTLLALETGYLGRATEE